MFRVHGTCSDENRGTGFLQTNSDMDEGQYFKISPLGVLIEMLPRLKMIPPFFYLISCAISCHKFFFKLIFKIDWIASKKMKRTRYRFQKISNSHLFFWKEKLSFFAHQSLVASLSTLMEDWWISNFLKFNFTKRVYDSTKKKPLNMWAVFGWKNLSSILF